MTTKRTATPVSALTEDERTTLNHLVAVNRAAAQEAADYLTSSWDTLATLEADLAEATRVRDAAKSVLDETTARAEALQMRLFGRLGTASWGKAPIVSLSPEQRAELAQANGAMAEAELAHNAAGIRRTRIWERRIAVINGREVRLRTIAAGYSDGAV